MSPLPISNDMADLHWPENGLEAVPLCPICSTSKRELLYAQLSDIAFRCAKGKWNIYRCKNCSACYIDPRPNEATIGEAYTSYYTHSLTEQNNIVLGKVSLKKRIENGRRNERYGYNITPSIKFASLILALSPIHRRNIDRDIRKLEKNSAVPKLLDLGCGNGAFLKQMALLGWNIHGIEPDGAAVKAANVDGLNVRQGLLNNETYSNDEFDAVTMSHVAEHLHNPIMVLGQCLRVLKPGGKLFILTPNIDSIGSRIFRDNWRGLEVPRHLVLFNFRSLELACKMAGFEIETAVGTPMAKPFFTMSLLLQQGQDPMGGQLKLNLLQKLAYKASNILSIVNRHNSEELMVVARKPR